jgi:Tol biopolymer transport system component
MINRVQMSLKATLMALLLTLPVAGDVNVTPLAHVSHYQPDVSKMVISDDGTHLIFQRGGHTRVLNLTDGTIQLVASSTTGLGRTALQLSADNSTLIYSDDSSGQIRYRAVSPTAPTNWGGNTNGDDYAISSGNNSIIHFQDQEDELNVTAAYLDGLTPPVTLLRDVAADFALPAITGGMVAYNKSGLYTTSLETPTVSRRISSEYAYGVTVDGNRFYYTQFHRSPGGGLDMALFTVEAAADATPLMLADDLSFGIFESREVALSTSPNGAHVALGYRDGLHIWDFAPGSTPIVLAGPDSRKSGDIAPVWSPDSRYVAFYLNDRLSGVNGLHLRDAEAATPLRQLTEGMPDHVIFSPDGRWVLTANDVPNSELVTDITIHDVQNLYARENLFARMEVQLPVFSFDGAFLAASDAQTAKVWNLSSLQANYYTLGAPGDNIGRVMFDTFGRLLYAGRLNGPLTVPCALTLGTGQSEPLTEQPPRLPGRLNFLAQLSADSTVYFTVSESVEFAEGVYSLPMGYPGDLALVATTVPEKEDLTSMPVAGNTLYFTSEDGLDIFSSASGAPANIVATLRTPASGRLKNISLRVSDDGEAAYVIREAIGDTCLDYTLCDEVVPQDCETLCIDNGYRLLEELPLLPSVGESTLFVVGGSAANVEIDQENQRFAAFNYPSTFGRIDTHVPGLGTTRLTGKILGFSPSTDSLYLETADNGNPCAPNDWCKTTRILRLPYNAPSNRLGQTLPVYTYDSLTSYINGSIYSTPLATMILSPSDYTLQLLPTLTNATPIQLEPDRRVERSLFQMSPDQRYAAYLATDIDYGYQNVVVIDIAKQRSQPLALWKYTTFSKVGRFCFTPDSQSIVVSATDHRGQVGIYSAPSDGSAPAARRSNRQHEVTGFEVWLDSSRITYYRRVTSHPTDFSYYRESVPLYGGSTTSFNPPPVELNAERILARNNIYLLKREEESQVLYAMTDTSGAPAFSLQPRPPAPLRVGRGTTLRVGLADGVTASLQWEFSLRNPDGTYGPYLPLQNRGGYRGVTTDRLRINVSSPGNQFAGRYRCVATNPAGFAYSRPIFITITN